MAERRMFAKTIVLSDAFLDMPMSARCLYFTLGMLADDDGFVNAPRSIMRQCGSSEDDMRILISKKFVLEFESGVIVIKHWRINNYLQKDRIQPTKYSDEKEQLSLDEKGCYHRAEPLPTASTTNVYTSVYTQNSIDKDSIDEDSIGHIKGECEGEIAKKPKRASKAFFKPTVDEIRAYCEERGNGIDPEEFFDKYEGNGWVDKNGNPMKDWKATIRTWERWRKENPQFRGGKNQKPKDDADYYKNGESEEWQSL